MLFADNFVQYRPSLAVINQLDFSLLTQTFCHYGSSSSSSVYCAGQRFTPHYRTLEVRPGRITKKLELEYDYDCERDDTKSLLGVLMLGWDVVIANNE